MEGGQALAGYPARLFRRERGEASRVDADRVHRHRYITEFRARCVRLDTDLPLLVEADGELLGTTPATFEVIPGAIQLKI